MSTEATIVVTVLSTAVITFVATWALIISQHKARKLGYELPLSSAVVPFETSEEDDLQVRVRKRLVEPPENDADGSQLIPAGKVYGFRVRLANVGNDTIERTEVGFQLDPPARVVSARVESAPTGYPEVVIIPQYEARRHEGRLWLPYLKRGEEVVLSIQSVRNESLDCEVFVPQPDVTALDLDLRRLRYILGLLTLTMLAFGSWLVGIGVGVARYGPLASTSELREDAPIGYAVMALQAAGPILVILTSLAVSALLGRGATRRVAARVLPWLISEKEDKLE